MTLPLPPFDPGDPAGLQFILDRLAGAAIDTGGQAVKLRFGAATVTWPGGARLSNGLNVTHGLGGTPIAVVTCADWAGPFNHSIVQAPNATQFTLYGYTTDASLPALGTTGVHYWLAIG